MAGQSHRREANSGGKAELNMPRMTFEAKPPGFEDKELMKATQPPGSILI